MGFVTEDLVCLMSFVFSVRIENAQNKSTILQKRSQNITILGYTHDASNIRFFILFTLNKNSPKINIYKDEVLF